MDDQAIADVFAKINARPPPILWYSELHRLEPCIFLYEGKNGMGHWCCILRHKDSWEIFDPIGMYPDAELRHPKICPVPEKLDRLCDATPLRVDYNANEFQTGGRACGLWCVFRFLRGDLDCDQFKERFQDVTDEDICNFFKRPDLLV